MTDIVPNILVDGEEAHCAKDMSIMCTGSECMAFVWLDIEHELGICGNVPTSVEFVRRALTMESLKVV